VGLSTVGLLLPLRRPRCCRCSARAALSGDSLRAHRAGSPRPEPDLSESAVFAPPDSLSPRQLLMLNAALLRRGANQMQYRFDGTLLQLFQGNASHTDATAWMQLCLVDKRCLGSM